MAEKSRNEIVDRLIREVQRISLAELKARRSVIAGYAGEPSLEFELKSFTMGTHANHTARVVARDFGGEWEKDIMSGIQFNSLSEAQNAKHFDYIKKEIIGKLKSYKVTGKI